MSLPLSLRFTISVWRGNRDPYIYDRHFNPMTSRLWNISIHSSVRNVGIRFGDSLTILTNGTDASFKEDSDTPINFPLYQESAYRCTLEIKSKYPKLHDIFSLKSIFYIEKTMKKGSTSSKQPKFWQKILELTPCDTSLIIDDCTNTTVNCTALTQDSVKCLSNDIMWLRAEKSSWQEIRTISCDENKEWKLTNENGTEIVRNETMRIRCAAEEPEPWNAANTILHAFILPFILYFIMQ